MSSTTCSTDIVCITHLFRSVNFRSYIKQSWKIDTDTKVMDTRPFIDARCNGRSFNARCSAGHTFVEAQKNVRQFIRSFDELLSYYVIMKSSTVMATCKSNKIDYTNLNAHGQVRIRAQLHCKTCMYHKIQLNTRILIRSIASL